MMKEKEKSDGRTDENTFCRIMTKILVFFFQRGNSNTTDGRTDEFYFRRNRLKVKKKSKKVGHQELGHLCGGHSKDWTKEVWTP